MNTTLLPNEKIEDLQYDGLQLIQSATEYRFTTDAVLLANFCGDMTGKLCVELGAGSGVISILVCAKKHPKNVLAIELQPQLANMMQRSVQLNNLTDKITVCQGNLKDAPLLTQQLMGKPADVVICNPPYRRVGSGEQQLATNIAICRHELQATLADVVASVAKTLNNKGVFYLVHQSSRLAEIVTLCHQKGIAVKQITPVCPKPDTAPNLVLVKGIKGGAITDCVLSQSIIVSKQGI